MFKKQSSALLVNSYTSSLNINSQTRKNKKTNSSFDTLYKNVTFDERKSKPLYEST